MPLEILDVMREASQQFCVLDELHEKVGQRIAAMLGVEAAYVTAGAACGLQLTVAACMTGTDPVKIEVTGHRAETDDEITLAGIAGITPSLDGTYTVTYVDDDNYSLQGTDSSDYSGTYTSGGTSAYAGCNGLRKNCWQRKNETMFGGFPGLLAETMRIA